MIGFNDIDVQQPYTHLIASRLSWVGSTLQLPKIATTDLNFEYFLYNKTKDVVIKRGQFVSFENVPMHPTYSGDVIELHIDTDISLITELDVMLGSFEIVDITNMTSLVKYTKKYAHTSTTDVLISGNNPELKSLNLYNSRYADTVTFSDFPKLDYVDARYCKFTTMDFSGNPLLHTLYADNMNTLTSVNLDNCISKLYQVFLRNCNLQGSLNVSDRPKLKYLYIDKNSLTDVTTENNPILSKLYIYNNLLTNFTITNTPVLRQLYFYNNPTLLIYTLPSNNSIQFIRGQNANLQGIVDLSSVMYRITKDILLQDNNITKLNLDFADVQDVINFDTRNNPLLTCIQVQTVDLAFAQANFTNIDAQTIIGDTPC